VFLGHIGVAFAAKRVAPRTSLGTLLAAAVLLDLVWPIFVLVGIEEVRVDPGNTAFTPLEFVRYPLTHGAVAVALWSLAFGAVYLGRTGYWRGAATVGALVASHWALDFVTHRPDLPLVWDDPKVGLGLWNSVPATLAVELAIFFAGLALYAHATRPRDRAGRIAPWPFVAFLLLIYAANVLGPPPPSWRLVAVAGLAQWLFLPWGSFIDRHRSAAAESGTDPPGGAPVTA
jgi:hypothetical protein